MPLDLSTRENVIAVQNELARIGFLDPPADGGWGPVSRWAMQQWLNQTQLVFMSVPHDQVMQQLRETHPLELQLGKDFASRIVQAMVDKAYFVNLHPGCVNIVYVEGVDTDGKSNGRPWNGFYDVRTCIKIDRTGSPVLAGCWEATTQPGEYWTQHRMNPEGAFHIGVGQFKAWSHGTHHTHEAWVQTGNLNGYRDANNKRIRDLEHPASGDDMGVNQHWGYDLPRDDVENSSAGCLVGRLTDGHRKFMQITKGDARFVANPAYQVIATILQAEDVNG